MKFEMSNQKEGCLFVDDLNYFRQSACSPELEQAELDVTIDSAGAITDVETCFYPKNSLGLSGMTSYKATAHDSPGGDQCLKYISGGENSPDTIDGHTLLAWGRQTEEALYTGRTDIRDYVPIKLHLIPQ